MIALWWLRFPAPYVYLCSQPAARFTITYNPQTTRWPNDGRLCPSIIPANARFRPSISILVSAIFKLSLKSFDPVKKLGACVINWPPPLSMETLTQSFYSLFRYERTVYYGTSPPPFHHLSPSHSYSHPNDQHLLQPEYHERTRAHSHSHSHSYSHAPPHHSLPPPPTSAPPQFAKPSSKPKPKPKPHKSSGGKVQSSHSSHSVPQLNPNFQYSRCTGRKKALCVSRCLMPVFCTSSHTTRVTRLASITRGRPTNFADA